LSVTAAAFVRSGGFARKSAYRWFCRLGLEDTIPDHSSFSKNRTGRFRDSDLLRKIFEDGLRRCIQSGLIGGEGFAIDASMIPADAGRVNTLTPEQIVDLRAGVVVHTETTQPVRPQEVAASQTMINRMRDIFDLSPDRLAADTAYGTGPMLDWLVNDRDISHHIPVRDKTDTPMERLPRSKFQGDADGQRYICPQDKPLTARGKVMADNTRNDLAAMSDCRTCSLKSQCCPGTDQRNIRRSIYEDARDMARSLWGTPAYERARDYRKKVEMSFAQLKRTLGITSLRLRGLRNAAEWEFSLWVRA